MWLFRTTVAATITRADSFLGSEFLSINSCAACHRQAAFGWLTATFDRLIWLAAKMGELWEQEKSGRYQKTEGLSYLA